MPHVLVGRSLLAIGMFAALAACGGGDSADTADTPATTTDTTTTTTTVATASEGERLYQTCVACHQANGQGMPGAFPPLAGSEWVTGSPDRLIAILVHGMQGPITVAGTEYNGVMLPYGVSVEMSDPDLATLLTYVRSSWGNSASAISAEDVARVKAATAGRTTSWTAAELIAAMP